MDHGVIKAIPEKKIYLRFTDYTKAFDCVDHNKLRKILKEMGMSDHLICLLRNLYAGQEGKVKTLVAQTVKNLPAMWEIRLDPWFGKIQWRKKCKPIPLFLPRKSHELRSPADYSPWGCKESYMTERLHRDMELDCFKIGKIGKGV